MSTNITQKKEEQKWQAEDDARTLARVITLRSDTARMARAKQGAKRILADEKKMAKEKKEEVEALGRVAKDKTFFDYGES